VPRSGLGLETFVPRSWSWSQDLGARYGLGLETSRKVLTVTLQSGPVCDKYDYSQLCESYMYSHTIFHVNMDQHVAAWILFSVCLGSIHFHRTDLNFFIIIIIIWLKRPQRMGPE